MIQIVDAIIADNRLISDTCLSFEHGGIDLAFKHPHIHAYKNSFDRSVINIALVCHILSLVQSNH